MPTSQLYVAWWLNFYRRHYGYHPSIYYPKPSKSDLYDVRNYVPGQDVILLTLDVCIAIADAVEEFENSVCGGFRGCDQRDGSYY